MLVYTEAAIRKYPEKGTFYFFKPSSLPQKEILGHQHCQYTGEK